MSDVSVTLHLTDWIYVGGWSGVNYSPRWHRPLHFVVEHFTTNYSWRTFSSMVVVL